MLPDTPVATLTELDEQIFQAIVPEDHYLRLVARFIDFERFRPQLEEGYCRTLGRRPIDPVCMLKIHFLAFHYDLSDRRVIERAQTDMAFRWFLGFGLHDTLPDPSGNTHFRQRHGAERFAAVFQELIALARAHGLVNDRLRLKDATHILADVANVSPLQLAAQIRDRLLKAAEPFFPDWVAAQRLLVENLRQTTAELPNDERLRHRLEFLHTLLTQVQELAASVPPTQGSAAQRRCFERAVTLASKLLQDHADPETTAGLASLTDPEARLGWHGAFFVGYLLDMAIDADSEIITAINVLPGNGADAAEAADAITLIEQEEAAQGNDVAGLSLDGVGFNGPVLRELTDPEGLNLEVTVPPPPLPQRQTYGPERFALTVLENGQAEVTCPAGHTTRQRQRIERDTGYQYRFKASQCGACTQRAECLQNLGSKKGRTVIKNDYEAEYKKVREQAQTEAYQETRRTHPKIERKLGEIVRHHGQRRARYRGQEKVRSQAVLAGLVVNVKRMVCLFVRKALGAVSALPVRAELGGT